MIQTMTLQNKITTKLPNTITINSNFAEQRIDNFLFNKLKNLPKSHLYKMLRQGEIRVNKGRIGPSYKLQAGDIIRLPPFWQNFVAQGNELELKPGSNLINLLLNNIIFEDDRILVVNKPVGIAAHSGSGVKFGVIEILRAARPELQTLDLVHRLDRDTSGCLVLSKTRTALRQLHELIRDDMIMKKYLLLAKGCFKHKELTVEAPLARNQLSSGERIVTVTKNIDGGKECKTIFRPVRIYQDMSLLEAELKTGRTHQIRVHAACMKQPIAGDDKYGDKDFNNLMKEQFGLKRLFLHAKELRFVWPDGVKVNLVASLDSELEQTLMQLNHLNRR